MKLEPTVFNWRMFTWNPRRNLPEMKFQSTIKEIVFTLLFILGELKGNFVSEVVWEKQSIPYKSQTFLFWWNKCMRTCLLCTCFLPCDFISVSVYMIFFHPKWNFIFVKSTAMKWHPQRISFGLYHVNSYIKLTRHRYENIPFFPKWNLM